MGLMYYRWAPAPAIHGMLEVLGPGVGHETCSKHSIHGLCVLSWSVARRSSELDNIYAHPLPWYFLASSMDVLLRVLSLLHGMQALLRVSCSAVHCDSVLKTANAISLSTAATCSTSDSELFFSSCY